MPFGGSQTHLETVCAGQQGELSCFIKVERLAVKAGDDRVRLGTALDLNTWGDGRGGASKSYICRLHLTGAHWTPRMGGAVTPTGWWVQDAWLIFNNVFIAH